MDADAQQADDPTGGPQQSEAAKLVARARNQRRQGNGGSMNVAALLRSKRIARRLRERAGKQNAADEDVEPTSKSGTSPTGTEVGTARSPQRPHDQAPPGAPAAASALKASHANDHASSGAHDASSEPPLSQDASSEPPLSQDDRPTATSGGDDEQRNPDDLKEESLTTEEKERAKIKAGLTAAQEAHVMSILNEDALQAARKSVDAELIRMENNSLKAKLAALVANESNLKARHAALLKVHQESLDKVQDLEQELKKVEHFKISAEHFQAQQEEIDRLKAENMMLHNSAAELHTVRVELHENDHVAKQTQLTLQRQLSTLTIEKMKLAQQVGLLEAENAQLRERWVAQFEQWNDTHLGGMQQG